MLEYIGSCVACHCHPIIRFWRDHLPVWFETLYLAFKI